MRFSDCRALIDLRLVDIGDGGQLGIVVGSQRLRRRAAAAAPAAHQPDLDGIRNGLRGDDRRESGRESGAQRARGRFQEAAAFGTG